MGTAALTIQQFEESIKLSQSSIRKEFRKVVGHSSFEDPADFHALIRSAIDLGINTAQLSELLNVAPSTVSRWANGKAVPARYARTVIAERITGLLI